MSFQAPALRPTRLGHAIAGQPGRCATGWLRSVRIDVGIFRYIVQGFGWEIGSQVAREGIQTLKERADEPPSEPMSPRQAAKLARQREKQEARERKARDAAVARKRAEIEAQLAELKRRSGR